ncbi:MAG: FlgD immunoglobulin-like domain containing protein [bacterium]
MKRGRGSLLGMLLILSLAAACFAAGPDTLWTRAYSDTSGAQIRCIDQTSDSGFIFTGSIWIDDGYVPAHAEVYTVRLDANGDTLWTTNYTVSGDAVGYGVRQTPDGGFVTAGYTSSALADDKSVYLVKLNSLGGIVWEKTYGHAGGRDEANDVRVLRGDSGFVVVGFATTPGPFRSDVYLLRTDSSGDTLFTGRYDYTINDRGYSICETTDGYVIAGHVQSATEYDVLLLKTTSQLDTVWSRRYGGTSEYDIAYSIKLTPRDFGFIVAGQTYSYGAGGSDGWVLKTDLNGDTLWTRTVGDSLHNEFFAVDTTYDGGYVVGGMYGSVPFEDRKFYAAKISPGGAIEWEETYGPPRDECVCLDMIQTYDGGYIMGGYIRWTSTGYRNAYVIRLGDGSGSGVEPGVPEVLAVEASPNPFTASVRIRFTLETKVRPEIGIYDVAGRLVRSVPAGTLHPARHTFEWDGRDGNGADVPPGVYFCRIKAGAEEATGKLVLTR